MAAETEGSEPALDEPSSVCEYAMAKTGETSNKNSENSTRKLGALFTEGNLSMVACYQNSFLKSIT